MRRRAILVAASALMLATAIIAPAVSDAAATCTPPAGWVANPKLRGPQGQTVYSPPGKPKEGMACASKTADELKSVEAAQKAHDPADHNVACGYALPGHEAQVAALAQKAHINCADPKYAKPTNGPHPAIMPAKVDPKALMKPVSPPAPKH